MTSLLVIAGTDSSGGAGLTRDTAVATELGFQVRPVVTAVTAQTDGALRGSHPVPLAIVRAQIDTALDAAAPDAVKVGMLGTPEIAEAVFEVLSGHDLPVVLDPVLKSSSGGSLFSGHGFGGLFTRITLLTPNLDEAAALTGRPVARDEEEVGAQAQMLLDQGARAVLIKGGHGEGAESVDYFFGHPGRKAFTAPRLRVHKRGTGCTLSTAIACYMGKGHRPEEACAQAKSYVHTWLRAGTAEVRP